ncbi:MAG: hypothetical protein C5B54_04740 [Acidobacteria bacterium]|nr:MAG: hypothetical protein C5B54_04740 [Acidobacteriota bacterium]
MTIYCIRIAFADGTADTVVGFVDREEAKKWIAAKAGTPEYKNALFQIQNVNGALWRLPHKLR